MNGKIRKNITIFGGTGDLTYRKLLPAMYNLFSIGKMDISDRILAIGRRDYSNEDYIKITKDWVKKFSRIKFDEKLFEEFASIIQYFKMDFSNLEEYKKLSNLFCGFEIQESVFYYATAPSAFGVISDGVLSLNCRGQTKIVVEKPFGSSLEEADSLSKKLEKSFGKEAIYRIDHYLGKEMIRSIQTIRFKNPIFRSCWDSNSIEYVHITACEEVGVGSRAGYYDKAGALKDMVQNHLMQILSLIAMEEPKDEADIKFQQVEVLKSLRKIEEINSKNALLLAQYEGYMSEPNIDSESTTETFALCKIHVDNPRWKNVPFYISTGKKMASREMNIIITFKPSGGEKNSNVLVFKIQPMEGVTLKFNIKKPGESSEIIQAEMDFCQSCVLAHRINTPEAYERLLDAVMQSDRTWFSTWDQIYLSWKYIEELKEKYVADNNQIYSYEQGSKGPVDVSSVVAQEHLLEYDQAICGI